MIHLTLHIYQYFTFFNINTKLISKITFILINIVLNNIFTQTHWFINIIVKFEPSKIFIYKILDII